MAVSNDLSEYDSVDGAPSQEPQMPRPRPGLRQITEAKETLLWPRLAARDDVGIVWLRAERTPGKLICW